MKKFFAAWIISLVFSLAAWALGIYVIFHFVQKFW